MTRVSNCIKMLTLLKARGFMSREELAKELACNIRNISEYRKELEVAGYQFESVRGINGGYRLKDKALLPIVGLDSEEMQALVEVQEYISQNPQLAFNKASQKAFNKIMATLSLKKKSQDVYIKDNQLGMSKEIQFMIRKLEEAKNDRKVVRLSYKGMHDEAFKKIFIQPYEILYSEHNYYCLAYSLEAKDFRIYKFSEERMKNPIITNTFFIREDDFRIENYIGKHHLIKDEVFELDLIVFDSSALLLSENPSGIDVTMEWFDNKKLHYQCVMEGKMTTIRFLLSLRDQVEIRAPQSLKLEIKAIVQAMLKQYE